METEQRIARADAVKGFMSVPANNSRYFLSSGKSTGFLWRRSPLWCRFHGKMEWLSTTSAGTPGPVFGPEFLKVLSKLSLRVREGRSRGAEEPGLRSTKTPGTGFDFAGFRELAPGEDAKSIDWVAYARTERLFVKSRHRESSQNIAVLLDGSESMRIAPGEKLAPGSKLTSSSKLMLGQQLAAAFLIASLHASCTAKAAWFDASIRQVSPRLRSSMDSRQTLDFLSTPPQNPQPTNLSNISSEWRRFHFPADHLVVISDFFDERGFREPALRWAAQGSVVHAIAVHSEEECRPVFQPGDSIEDVETGERTVVGTTACANYSLAFDEFLDRIRRSALATGGSFFHAVSGAPFPETLLRCIRSTNLFL